MIGQSIEGVRDLKTAAAQVEGEFLHRDIQALATSRMLYAILDKLNYAALEVSRARLPWVVLSLLCLTTKHIEIVETHDEVSAEELLQTVLGNLYRFARRNGIIGRAIAQLQAEEFVGLDDVHGVYALKESVGMVIGNGLTCYLSVDDGDEPIAWLARFGYDGAFLVVMKGKGDLARYLGEFFIRESHEEWET